MTAPTGKGLIAVEDRAAYAVVRISRPEKRNALNAAARDELRSALSELRGTHRVIVLVGTGSSFCSGLDLKEYADGSNAPGRREAADLEWIQILLEIRLHPAIFIAGVNGVALGGGVSLINVCDLAVASERARIGMPELGFGIYPAMAGPSTQRMLAPKHAAWMVLTGRQISGRQAQEWGLVNECVDDDELEQHCDALARSVATFDAVALTQSKQALDTMPQRISEWAAIMEQGRLVNAAIREQSNTSSVELARFLNGSKEARPGPTP